MGLLYSRHRSQRSGARDGKLRLPLLPGTQNVAAVASRNDLKLSRGGRVGAFTGDFYRGIEPPGEINKRIKNEDQQILIPRKTKRVFA